MFKNYFKIAFRNAIRQKSYSIINISSLAIGLTCVILIALFITDELGYDRFFKDADQVYRVNINGKMGDGEFYNGYTPPPAGETLVANFPEIESYTRIYRPGVDVIEYSNGTEKQTFNENNVYAVDANFLDILSYPLLKGNPQTCLSELNSIVITNQIAQKYFGDVDPMGKILFYGKERKPLKVTGVLQDMTELQTSVTFDILMPVKNFGSVTYFNWSWVWLQMATYVKLTEKAASNPRTVAHLESQFPEFIRVHAANAFDRIGQPYEEFLENGNKWDLHLQALTDIHLHSGEIESAITEQNSINNLYIFGVIAFFIIVLASVNFVNLATAQASKRSKEIGIRKVLGSPRIQLVKQFLVEAMFYTIIATILAILIVWFILPVFNQLAGKTLPFETIFQNGIWLFILCLSLLTALLAGIYPAFYLTSFKAVHVLKGVAGTSTNKGGFIGNGLVVFQFTIAIIMIIATGVIYLQLNYAQNRDLGYDKENLLVVQNTEKLEGSEETFRSELEGLSEVNSASISSGMITKDAFGDFYFPETINSDDTIAKDIILQSYLVDEHFMSTLDLKLTEGRGFEPKFNDSLSVIINEAAAKEIGWQNPIGSMIQYPGGKMESYKVVGVLKDFNLESLHSHIQPFALFSNASKSYSTGVSYITIKIKSKNVAKLIANIESKWTSYQPNIPFEYAFLDDDLNAAYDSDQRQANLFSVFAFLTIFIACMGLLGLIAFTAQQKTKEIGIRKVLGATITEIVSLLASDFIKVLVIAMLIASPIAWYFMDKWLQDFAYKIEMPWWLFLLSGIIALTIAMLTIGFQSLKSAMANPTKSLRSE
ncbi:ABC transporter permease [Aurantibacter crassamenti]|uniref:ABC transporter permease n=1 Tax=Aurantibacter crassamenti TaxID=1837375 RepID=UPI001939C5E2|nr:ABC transporter permease [Aurantibacter crassamenti]MBM1106514.1 ABC transporter permease [Aurantibacter crassamenti]